MSNPYLIQGPALISFSGGRTSGYMLKHILDAHGGTLPDDVHVAFANTGREMPETLDFVQECSDRWGVRIVWLEFDPEEPHQTKVVSHNSASRNGEPLSAAIRTRPTPHLFNRISAYCTGMTKQKRLDRFARHWCGFDTWHSVRGIRHDEPRRVKSQRIQSSPPVLLPLDDARVVGADIAAFWGEQTFDLRLPGRDGVTELGNCVLCPRKSRARLIRILRDNPEAADIDWWLAHEREMGERVKDIPRNRPELPEMRNRFLLGGESYADLARVAAWQRENPEPRQVDLFEGEESLDCACTD